MKIEDLKYIINSLDQISSNLKQGKPESLQRSAYELRILSSFMDIKIYGSRSGILPSKTLRKGREFKKQIKKAQVE